MDEPTERVCLGCREVKSLDQFSKAPRGKWGRKARCKACDATRHKRQKIYTTQESRDATRQALLDERRSGPKVCAECGESKPREEFGISKHGKHGPILRSNCKPCGSARARAWYYLNQDRADGRKRVRELDKYGITLQDYEDMLRAQGGVCAICGGVESNPKFNRLSVDHCHDTGAVRGLLCNRCNRALGLLNDDAILLRKAISYLRRGGK